MANKNFVVQNGLTVGELTIFSGNSTITSESGNVSIAGNLTVNDVPIQTISVDGTLSANSNAIIPTQWAVKSYVDTIGAATSEPTGFNREDLNSAGIFEFSLDGTTIYSVDQNQNLTTRTDGKFATGTVWEEAATARTLAIYPAAGQTSFVNWQAGIRYIYTTLQKASFAAGGPHTHYFFFDQGVLSSYNSISGEYIKKLPFVAEVYCNEDTNTVIILGEERHGITMDGATHLYLHSTSGTRYKSGLGITGISANATTYTSTVSGIIFDEDIALNIIAQTENSMLYMDGTTWRITPASNTYAYLSGGIAQYNLNTGGSYSLANVPSGKYAVMYFTATNCRIHHTMKIMGQRVFDTLAAARESAQTEPRDTSLLGLPSPEFLYVGAVVVDYQGKVQTLDNGAVFVDLRYVNISAGTNSTSAVQAVAADTFYNNSVSGLTSANVQGAIDELSNEKFEKTGGTISGITTVNGNLVAASSTVSTAATNGALVVIGGAGVGLDIHVGGGAGIAGNIFAGGTITSLGNIVAASGTAATDINTGALVVKGGAAVSGSLFVNGNFHTNGMQFDSGNGTFALTATNAEFSIRGITNEPATPTAGNLVVYSKSIGGRMMVKQKGPSGIDTPLQPVIYQNKIGYWNPPGNSTTVPGVMGMNAPTALGTATARNVATTNTFTRMRRLGYVSAATLGSFAGHYDTTAQYTVGNGAGLGGFYYVCRFGTSDAATVAQASMFVGLTSSVGAPTANVSPATFTNTIGVGCAPGGTTLNIYYGGSAAQTAIDLGAGFPTTAGSVNMYEAIFFAPTNVNNSVSYRVTNLSTNAEASGTLTAATPGTQLPAATTLLAHRAYRCNNTTALAVGIDVVTIYVETDY